MIISQQAEEKTEKKKRNNLTLLLCNIKKGVARGYRRAAQSCHDLLDVRVESSMYNDLCRGERED